MDNRVALTPGTELKLCTKTGCTAYTIAREIGRGGSCIVYEASFRDNLGYVKPVHIKECCPQALKVRRGEDGTLTVASEDEERFSLSKERLIAAYRMNQTLFFVGELTNRVTNTADIYEANGTVYIVSVYGNGHTFKEYQGKTLHECISLLLGVAKILRQMHENGYLYLDLKPENILTLEGSADLVQLFDFDSVISSEEITAALQSGRTEDLRTSYTRGYAPIELQTGRLNLLGPASDIFSLGAVLFFALWKRTPTAFDCDSDVSYDFESMAFSDVSYSDALFYALSDFLHHTLNSYYADRYQSAEAAIESLRKMLALSDETKPWLVSTPIQENSAFFGRREDIIALRTLLGQSSGKIVNLNGLGGIGKSTLVRQLLKADRASWDAVFWLYDDGSLSQAVADDLLVQIHTVHKMPEESFDDYIHRKLTVLSDLAGRQRILLILDNFDPAHIDQLEILRRVGWTILIISREGLPEGYCPSLNLEEMKDDALEKLFLHHAHYTIRDEADQAAVRSILFCLSGHTLLVELIARQIHMSYLTISEAQSLIEKSGFTALPNEKIDYIRDKAVIRDGLARILDHLLETNRFSDAEKCWLKLLSLFDMPGIDGGLFRALAALSDLDFANELERLGWLKRDRAMIYMHPLMQEYIRTWPWTEQTRTISDQMMVRLYDRIHPAGTNFDGNRQASSNYAELVGYMRLAEQMISHAEKATPASQRLMYRCLVDAPVDQDETTVRRMLALLARPDFLEPNSVLRLYEMSAYLLGRLCRYSEAVDLLRHMKSCLARHPSAYYLSAYHQAMAVILHNEDYEINMTRCLRHQNQAIAAARLSSHPEAKKQLITCLQSKCITILSNGGSIAAVRRLLAEADPLVARYTDELDYERYQFNCVSAMFHAIQGHLEKAEHFLNAADDIALQSPDSDLSTVEHLTEQVAMIRLRMNQPTLAEKAVLEAIELCDRHEDMARYRSARFEAYTLLGFLYEHDGEYILSQQAYEEAEARIADAPQDMDLPLCPEEVRRLAKRQRENEN